MTYDTLEQVVAARHAATEVVCVGDDIWIVTPATTGRWLSPDERAIVRDLWEQARAAPAPAPAAPAPEDEAIPTVPEHAGQRNSKPRTKLLSVTPQQKSEAMLIAFAILISSRIETEEQAQAMATLLLKLRDRARLWRKRMALAKEKPSPSLERRTRTVLTHLYAIGDHIEKLQGTKELKIVYGKDGYVTVSYGRAALVL